MTMISRSWRIWTAMAAICVGMAGMAHATNYAVCVGVNTYNSSYCSNPLNGCVPDAQHMTNLITARGEWTAGNVTFLSNSGATLTKIRQAVSNVAKKAVSGDKFLYYHSSHGGNDVYYFTTSSGKQYLHYGLDSTGVSNYICSYNADYTAKMMATDLASFPSGVKIVVMMDTCHSAGMFKYNTTTSSKKALLAKLAAAKAATGEEDGSDVEEPAPENSVSGFFMEAVLDQLAQAEAEQVRRGLRPRSAKSLASDVGWIAAADYDQYSWDGDSGGAFTEAFVNGVTNQNKMCDNATYGNQDGYASFYEGWNYAKDIARGQRDYSAWDYDSNAGYYDYIWTDAQCTNTAVLDSVLVGWAGKTAPANVAPSFSPSSISTNVVQGGELEYTFSAAGTPTPTYTLSTSVSSSLYEFDNGYLYFQPTATGTYTFTCTASNTQGTATCTLTVTVTTPPPATPEVPSTPPAADTTSFTASWSAVANAASYKLYVQRKVSASTSARAARDISLLSESFEDNEIPSGWTKSGSIATASGKSGDGTYCVAFKAANAYLITPALDNPSGISFIYKRSSNTTAWELDVSVANSVDGPWTSIGTVNDADNSEWKTFSAPISLSGTVYVKFTDNRSSGTHERYVDLVQVTGASDTWEDVPGSPFTVSGTSRTISGLSAGTEYRYSVAAVNSQGVESEPSAYVTVETAEGNSAPSISVAQTSYAVTVGDPDVDFTVTVTGSPAPTVTHSCTEGAFYVFEDGEFLFTPDTVGTYHFVFTATNSEGSDSVTVTVTVSSAPITVPTLMVDDCTDTTAYAIWDECTGVTSYTLQLASDDQFTTGGSGGEVTLFSNAANDPSAAPDGWTYNVKNTSGSYLQLLSGNYVVTEAFDASACTALSLSLYMRTYGGTTQPSVTVQYSTDGGTTWSTSLGTLSAANTTMAQRTLNVSSAAGTSSVRLRIASTSTSTSVGVGIQNIVLTGTESSGSGSLISTTTVTTNEYTFTGLTPYTPYYARVKGNDDWSNVAEFITEEAVVTDTAPSWSAIPAINVTVGEYIPEFHPANYVSGTPAPTVTLSETTATSGTYLFDDGLLTFQPSTLGSFTFTFLANNGIGSPAYGTLTVASTGTVPVVSVPQTSYSTSLGGADVAFTVTATGTPTPTLALSDTTATSGIDFDENDGCFSFTPYATGSFTFTFTANSLAGSDSVTVTVTVSAAAVTIPTLTVTNVTDTTALASWTACDGVSTYTLQLTDDAFPAATSSARSLTPILSEDFSGFTPTSNTDIGSNNTLNNYTTNSGWTGIKVYPEDEQAKIGAGSAQGWLATPALTVSGSLTVVWEARRYGTGDKNTLLLGISEDGTTFTDTSIDLYDDMTVYTNTFEVSGTTAYVRWMGAVASKARFYLDNVRITTPESGGGDDPGGDSVQTFTVTGTSYTFTNLAPATPYLARVKGNATWSEEVYFATLGSSDTAPSIEAIANQTYTYGDNEGWFTLTVTATGTPAPGFSVASSDAPEGSFTIGENDGEFLFEPTAVGTFHFTVTAANGVSPDATATFAVTVTGTAPTLAAIADRTVAVEEGQLTVGLTVTGNPAPTVTVASSDAPDDSFCIDSNGDFYFLFDEATGTFHFTITAANGVSPDATQSFTVTVTAAPEPLTDYQQWLQAHGIATDTSADATAPNGHTYGQNYAADIAPTDTNFLDLVITDVSSGQFTILNYSTNRWYQLLYTTDLTVPLESYMATNLGKGATSGTFPVDGDWYGGIRVLLDEP